MGGVLRTIYDHSPLHVQNLLVTAEGYRLRHARFGAAYRDYRQTLDGRNYSDNEALQAGQDHAFVEFVRFASSASPFYREYYRGIRIDKIRGVADAPILPILEKETLRANLSQIYTRARRASTAISTSGTTGTALTFRYDPIDFQKRMAYLDHFKAQHGFHHLAMKRASFTSSKVVPAGQLNGSFWRMNRAMRQRIYSGYHCHGANIESYVEDLMQYAPDALDGYPSSLDRIAVYILENQIRLPKPPIAIFPTAESLLPHSQARIEAAFGAPVFDQYASSEGAPFVTMCSLGNRHYCLDTGLIEEDLNGDILITGFETHGTPLIRYRIGDRMTLAARDTRCPCGSALPLVSSIAGRTDEYLFASDGHPVPAIYLSLVDPAFAGAVRSMQFVQRSIGTIEVRLDLTDGLERRIETIIREKLSYSLGADTSVLIDCDSPIQIEESGKQRLIVNLVPRELTEDSSDESSEG